MLSVFRVTPLGCSIMDPNADSEPAYLKDLLQESVNDVWGVLDVTDVEYVFDLSPLRDPVRLPMR